MDESDVFEVAASLVCFHRWMMWSDDRLLEDEEDGMRTHEEQPEVISPCCLVASQVRLASSTSDIVTSSLMRLELLDLFTRVYRGSVLKPGLLPRLITAINKITCVNESKDIN